MKLATMDDIADLKVDHSLGSLVDARTGKTAGLSPFRIVYARHSKKLFSQGLDARWKLDCSSPDAVTGTVASTGKTRSCGSVLSECGSCKPVLTLGLITAQRKMVVLETSASIARTLNQHLYKLSELPVPIFEPFWSLRLMSTQKSSEMSYTQVTLNEVSSLRDAPSYAECLQARRRLGRMIDARVDKSPGAARPSLGGAALKM